MDKSQVEWNIAAQSRAEKSTAGEVKYSSRIDKSESKKEESESPGA